MPSDLDPRPKKLRQEIKDMEVVKEHYLKKAVQEIRRGNVADALKFRDLFFASSKVLKQLYHEGAAWILGRRR